jgi:transposase-like protein
MKKSSCRKEQDYHEHYSIRTYKCIDCGKTIEVDSRSDIKYIKVKIGIPSAVPN